MTRIVFSLPIAKSRYLSCYLACLHLVMLAMVFSLALQSYFKAVLIVGIAASAVYYFGRYHQLNGRHSVLRVERDAQQQWYLTDGVGNKSEGRILERAVVTSKVTILYFKHRYFWHTQAVTIMVDAVDSELFRQLRVYCRDPKTFQK